MFRYKQYKVEFFHSTSLLGPCVPWSQQTVCTITEDHETVSEISGYGVAMCSRKDHFSRSKGREIAFQRALSNLTADKSKRREFWLAFWNSDDGRKTKGSVALRRILGTA